MNLKFSGRGLAFLSNYMAKNDIRYYLNGIFIKPIQGGGAVGVASNGHIAGLWHDKHGVIERPAILSVTAPLVRACSSKGLYGVAPTLELRDGRLACMSGESELYIQPNESTRRDPGGLEPWEVQGKFPDIGRLLPSPEEFAKGSSDTFSSGYLAVVARSFKGNGVVLRQASKSSAAVLVAGSVPEAVAIIMPMRDVDAQLPAWLSAIR